MLIGFLIFLSFCFASMYFACQKQFRLVYARMHKLEACVIEEDITPEIITEKKQKAIEDKKPKWGSIRDKYDNFPNYKNIKRGLGNDEYSLSALAFASKVYKEYELQFDSSESRGFLYVDKLKFESMGNNVKCENIREIVFDGHELTSHFEKCLKF